MTGHEFTPDAGGAPDPSPGPHLTTPAEERRRLRPILDEQFGQFYRANIRLLIAFLIRQGAPTALAADLAQDAMIKAYEKWTELREPRAWVHTVASRSLVRWVARTREDPVEQVPEPTGLLPDPDAVTAWEMRQELLCMLRTLPPRQRQILAWRMSGFAPAEIAAELGITSGAVRASLNKARAAAAAELTRGGAGHGDE